MDHLLDRLLQDLHADDHDQHRDDEAGHIFVAAVAEGMVFVRTFPGGAEAPQGDDGGRGVGQVVDAVSRDGNGPRQPAGEKFQKRLQEVEHDARHAAQSAITPPDSGVIVVLIVLYKQFCK